MKHMNYSGQVGMEGEMEINLVTKRWRQRKASVQEHKKKQLKLYVRFQERLVGQVIRAEPKCFSVHFCGNFSRKMTFWFRSRRISCFVFKNCKFRSSTTKKTKYTLSESYLIVSQQQEIEKKKKKEWKVTMKGIEHLKVVT